jgi:hypothetical protein
VVSFTGNDFIIHYISWRLLPSPTRPLEDPKAMDLYAASSSSYLLTFPCTRILEFISLSVDLETNERSSII